MTYKKILLLVAAAGTAFAAPAYADLNWGEPVQACATSLESRKVQAEYEKAKGAPLAVISRRTKLPEVRVASGVAPENRVAIAASPELVKQVWATLDAWGKDTLVRMVFTMGGGHVLDFPSKVPITQEDLDDGWIDIYADNGDGVHGHLWLDRIASIHVVDIPGQDDVRTRTVSFYGPDGKLALGVYASITTKDFDAKAVAGFEQTKALVASLQQICG